MHSNRAVCRSVFVISQALCLIQTALPITHAYSANESLLIQPKHFDGRNGKYSIDDLLNGKFPNKVSDDIDLDPGKWRKFAIAMCRCCIPIPTNIYSNRE